MDNKTNITAATELELHNKSSRQLVRIQGYVCLTAAILAFLVFFGSCRRRCHSKVFKILLWSAYILCTYLINYTMGQMQSASFNNELFPIWASFLLFVLGSSDSISAFSLEDNEHRTRYNWQVFVQSFWLGWLIGMYSKTKESQILLWLLLVVISLKTGERARSYMLASRSVLRRNTKLIMDFMGYEHELSNQNEGIDPTCMRGYNYMVRGEDDKLVTVKKPLYQKRLEINHEVITVHKIWHCEGRLLTSTSDPEDRLKDICLSFALHKLLCRRFVGHPLLECGLEKTWRFVQDGLLFKEDDNERAFRVIEVELAFLFDLLYTKYPVIFEKGRLKYKIIEFITLSVSCWIGVSLLIDYKRSSQRRENLSLTYHGHSIDALVTGIVIVTMIFLEVVQIFSTISSNWAKVILLCKYVENPSWQANKCIEKMIEFICRTPSSKPWQRKIGQYSLLASFNHNPSILIYNSLTSDFLDNPGNGRKESHPAKLTVQVKKAVILSLKNINRQKLSNGEASLHRNGVENITWATRELETTTHVIMVWHIATSLCELDLSISVSRKQRMRREHFIVATSLSKYCAYLVAFAPDFVPADNAYVSEFIFDQIIIETRDALKKCKSMKKIFEKMMALGDGDPGDTIIKRGAVLGKYLIRRIESEEHRWKVLADFWAEMILFVAPSDNATVHVEYLAQGGEFVTHLWALLSHAGILKRETDVPQI